MSPPSDIIIRAQEPADIPGLSDTFDQPQVIWGTLATPLISTDQRQRRWGESPANVARLVAVIDGRLIGAASLHREERHRRSHAGSLGMAVHDAYAGRGAGTALLAAIVDLADRWWNLRRLELEVYADNARAIALYERFGFQREGLLRAHAFRDGSYVDTIPMGRLRP
ncbi:GNAT family N-acetyltransferase [Phenylobacterium sp.]|uniref:GNAT family N-acetyltransferase n=1 Tax=Phenylobacterium sp. TaxID=1871053 RepID=UPI002DF2EDFC|nr:GNAT family N-acetyltransferase [Phenylobacterium sp.]